MRSGYPFMIMAILVLSFLAFEPIPTKGGSYQYLIIGVVNGDNNCSWHSSFYSGDVLSIGIQYHGYPYNSTISGDLNVTIYDRQHHNDSIICLTPGGLSVSLECWENIVLIWDQKDENGTQVEVGEYLITANLSGLVGSNRFILFDPENPSPIEVTTDKETYQYYEDPIFTTRNLVDWGIPGQNPGDEYHINSENFSAHVPDGWTAHVQTFWLEVGSNFSWSFGEMIDYDTGERIFLPPGNYTVWGRMGLFNDTTTFRIVGSPPIPEYPQDPPEEENGTEIPAAVDPTENVTDPQPPDPPVDGTGSPEEMNETITQPLDQQPPVKEIYDRSTDKETIDLPDLDIVEKAPPEDPPDQKTLVSIPPNHEVEDGSLSIFERIGIINVGAGSILFITAIVVLVLKKK